jgi:predicted outer membrane repeat protein
MFRVQPIARSFAASTILAAVAASAWGAGTVTLCGTDTQIGAGKNLKTALAGGGLVQFQCGGPAVITITQRYTIAENTIIDGNGAITLDRGGGFGIFLLGGGVARLDLRGMTLRNGRQHPPGSLEYNFGTIVGGTGELYLANMRVETSYAPVDVRGAVLIEDSTFANNIETAVTAYQVSIYRSTFRSPNSRPVSVYGPEGASSFLLIDDHSLFADGWAIRVDHGARGNCRVKISASQFIGNRGIPYGGALYSNCETVIDHSGFSGNQTYGGGAIYLAHDATTAVLRGVHFTDNAAIENGGAIEVVASSTRHTLSLQYCTFTRNTAQDGGAIELGSGTANDALLTASAVVFDSNTARRTGGAIHGENASARIQRASFRGNAAMQRGGAISIDAYTQHELVLANALVTGNHAPAASALSAVAAQIVNVTFRRQSRSPFPGSASAAQGAVEGYRRAELDSLRARRRRVPDTAGERRGAQSAVARA